jgi:hypothetical protein
MREFEHSIARELRTVTGDSTLKLRHIIEWSTSEAAVRARVRIGETVIFLPSLQVWVAYKR